jgi:hypothetical protein
MSADNTANKSRAWLAENDSPFGTMACPTCERPMSIDLMHALYAVDNGDYARAADIRIATCSHVVPDADGGDTFALECMPCNHARGRSEWVADGVATYEWRSKDLAANKIARRRVAGSREWLARQGYPTV